MSDSSKLSFLKLTLLDFRNYMGSHEIEFSSDPTKHLTVVHAENSTGKTTMLNAIKWCLYGDTPDFDNKNILVNDKSKKTSCKVTLEFKYENVKYQAVRTYDQNFYTNKLTLFKISNSGAREPQPEGQSIINTFLPKEISNYFLFAGEHFTRSFIDNKKTHRTAIRNILGFNLPERAIEDLNTIASTNKRLINKLAKDNETTSNMAKAKEILDDRIAVLDGNIESYKENIELYEKLKQEANEKILNSNHSKAEALEAERKEKENTKKTYINLRKNQEIKKYSLIQKYGYALFGKILSDIDIDDSDGSKYFPLAPYDEILINGIIKDKKCICGTDILPNTSEYKNILSQRTNATTNTIKKRIQKAQSISTHFKARAREFLEDSKDISLELDRIIREISALENRIDEIDKELESLGDINIQAFIDQRAYAESELKKLYEQRGFDKKELEEKKTKSKNLEREIKKSAPRSAEAQEYEDINKLIERLVGEIENKLTITEKNSLVSIQENVQKNVDKSMRQNLKVKIGADYSFMLVKPETGRTITGGDGGNGLKHLTSLSFVTALIAQSKKRVNRRRNIFQPGTIAPFVIDAPFAEMDTTLQKNALEFLPQQSHQLILFLSSGQWNKEYENIIGEYIGKRYILVNHDLPNDDTVLKETIEINGINHSLTEPNSSLSQTTIKDIHNA